MFEREPFRWGLFLIAICAAGCTGVQYRSPAAILPLVHVRLYETGIGYFERHGVPQVKAALPIPAGHLDDALKTLTIVGENDLRSTIGLRFPSTLTRGVARALAGLSADDSDSVTFVKLMQTLRGKRLQLTVSGQALVGRLVDVSDDRAPTASDGTSKTVAAARTAAVLLLTDDGSLRRLALSDVSALHPLDHQTQARLRSAVGGLSSKGGRRAQLLSLLAKRDRPIRLGYIAETPLWRATYRLIDTRAGRSSLRGWALVHNDTAEHWRGVKVSIVSGRPDSFLFPLAVPRYLRRRLVHPQRRLPTVPQLLNTTPDEIWGDQLDDGQSDGGSIGSGYGSGSTSGRGSGRGVKGMVVRSGPRTSDELIVGNLASYGRPGLPAGAPFGYTTERGIDLLPHSSALLPFLHAETEAQRVTHFAGFAAAARRVVVLVNRTQQTLPAGTIAIYQQGRFVGESYLERTKPGQRRFVAYGTDVDLELQVKRVKQTESVKRLVFRKGRLEEHYLKQTQRSIELSNRDDQLRTVQVQLPVSTNAKVSGADKLDFDGDHNKAIAIFRVAAGVTLQRTLETVEGLVRFTSLGGLNLAVFDRLAKLAALSVAQRPTLERGRAIAQQRKTLEEERDRLHAQVRQRTEELERLQGHLRAAGGAKAAGPLVARVLVVEDALAKQRAKIAAIEERDRQLERQLSSVMRQF